MMSLSYPFPRRSQKYRQSPSMRSKLLFPPVVEIFPGVSGVGDEYFTLPELCLKKYQKGEVNRMNIKVVYHSRLGNTKKIAEAIASAVNVKAEAIDEKIILSESIDLLFIGGGIYWSNMDKITKKFIQTLDSSIVKNAAVFGTMGRNEKAITDMINLLNERKINTKTESYVCKGQAWGLVNRNHPDQSEIEKAKEFGRKIVGLIGKK